jgi:hypothetical protein
MILTTADYKNILKYYKITDAQLRILKPREIKEKAEHLLATKLCKCIKKVSAKSKSEAKAIAICNTSVIKKKKLAIFNFTCKKGYKLLPKKGTRKVLLRRA